MIYPIYMKYKDGGNPVILRGTVEAKHTAKHNKISWARIAPFIDDGLTLAGLTDKLIYHDGPMPTPRAFILYCCDLKYLRIKPMAI